MKYKIIYPIFILIIMFIPLIVKAEECDISKITITSIEQIKIEGNTEVLEETKYKDRDINLNLKMYEVGDSIAYNIKIKNDSKENYMIDENTFKTDSEYIVYTLKTNDGNNVVKANSSKNIELIVTYKKEIDSSLLNNNKYDASNNLKLSLNTSLKEKELNIITTDDLKNPLTRSSIIRMIILLLISLLIINLNLHKNNKYNMYLILIISILFIPIGYAACKCDIEVNSTIEIEKLPKLYDTIKEIETEDNSCITKYEGNVTDEVGKTVSAKNVYFNKCEDKRNIIFADNCWQIIRTTENGGTKVIYNGEPVNGKCETNRPDHKGVTSSYNYETYIKYELLYGNSFTYDSNTNTFTLVDTQLNTWTDATSSDLIGKYTCGNTSDTCETLYNINNYISDTNAHINVYTISDINYAEIANITYNAFTESPAMVGYMFNNIYYAQTINPGNTEYKYGNSFTYNENTGLYELSGQTKNSNNWNEDLETLSNTHYTCWNLSGKCENISYIFYTLNDEASYINLSNGESINDALNKMLYENVNVYNSDAKGIIDNWYQEKLLNYSNKIDNPVYCNDRTIVNYSGWNPNISNYNSNMKFKNETSITSLECTNKTDQFSTNNNKAKLTYPIALITGPEESILNNPTLLATNSIWWTLSPFAYCNHRSASNKIIMANGTHDDEHSSTAFGIRPVITLKDTNLITSGNGSAENPWKIGNITSS